MSRARFGRPIEQQRPTQHLRDLLAQAREGGRLSAEVAAPAVFRLMDLTEEMLRRAERIE